MMKQLFTTTAAVAALSFFFAVPSRAGVITSTILATSQPADFSGNYPLPEANIGDFTFPEPATLTAITLGLAGIALLRRRKA